MRQAGKRHFSHRRGPERETRVPQDIEPSNKSQNNPAAVDLKRKKRRIRLDEDEASHNQVPTGAVTETNEQSSFLAKLRKNKISNAEDDTTPTSLSSGLQQRQGPKPEYTATPIETRELNFIEPGAYKRIEEFNEFMESLDPDIRALIVVPTPPEQEWWDEGVEATREIVHPAVTSEKEDTPTKVYLTPKENARKRRNERQLSQAEARERIKRGIDPPPPPKLKISNVMAVTGSAYLQDPTKHDMIAREAEQQRHQAHIQANQERHEKSAATKWENDQSKILQRRAQGIHTAVFRVESLGGKQRFLVDYTAKKFLLTGALCIGTPTIVVVEGGEKEIRKYEKLLQSRIDWGDSGCRLVWKGRLLEAMFKKWSVHEMSPEDTLSFLAKFGCDGYWKLAN